MEPSRQQWQRVRAPAEVRIFRVRSLVEIAAVCADAHESIASFHGLTPGLGSAPLLRILAHDQGSVGETCSSTGWPLALREKNHLPDTLYVK